MSRVRRPASTFDDDYGYGDDDDVARAPVPRRASGYDRADADDGGYARRGRRVADDDDDDRARPSLALRTVALVVKHPVPVLGGGATLVLLTAIALNAMTSQPGHHPSPLFETRPYADAAATATTGGPRAPKPTTPGASASASDGPLQTASLPTAQPRMKPATADISALIKDLQTLMTARGLYRGDIDGVAGPGTADAIRALEKSLGLVQTGEASDRLLAYARERGTAVTTAPIASAPIPPPAPAPVPAAGTMAVPLAAAPQAVPTAVPAAVATPRAVPVKPTVDKPVVATAPRAVPVTRSAGQRAVPLVPQQVAQPVPQPGSIAVAQPPENRLARVQRALTAAGFGPLRADGVFDDPTVDAIRRYEVHRGWAPTGRLSDRLTLDLLMKSATR